MELGCVGIAADGLVGDGDPGQYSIKVSPSSEKRLAMVDPYMEHVGTLSQLTCYPNRMCGIKGRKTWHVHFIVPEIM